MSQIKGHSCAICPRQLYAQIFSCSFFGCHAPAATVCLKIIAGRARKKLSSINACQLMRDRRHYFGTQKALVRSRAAARQKAVSVIVYTAPCLLARAFPGQPARGSSRAEGIMLLILWWLTMTDSHQRMSKDAPDP